MENLCDLLFMFYLLSRLGIKHFELHFPTD